MYKYFPSLGKFIAIPYLTKLSDSFSLFLLSETPMVWLLGYIFMVSHRSHRLFLTHFPFVLLWLGYFKVLILYLLIFHLDLIYSAIHAFYCIFKISLNEFCSSRISVWFSSMTSLSLLMSYFDHVLFF